MMYANLRGADGRVLGSVAIDPSAHNNLQSAFADAMVKLQQQGGLPQNARPPQPTFLPPGPPQPTSQSRPFICQMRFLTRLSNGQVTWTTRAINCPVGLPPGIYTHQHTSI